MPSQLQRPFNAAEYYKQLKTTAIFRQYF